ncbi:MAG: hypothetical protein ACKVZ0_14595 [Gemmatimonadales bacterium]
MPHRHSLVREGAVCGMLGAAAVAAWFLAIDLINGRPLFTPRFLGGMVTGETDPTLAIVKYTALHLAAFLGFGVLVTELVHAAVRSPIFRFALMMLFVAFEFFFVGVSLLFLEGTTNDFPLWSVLAANTIAAAAMTLYLWKRHPSLIRSLRREALGS